MSFGSQTGKDISTKTGELYRLPRTLLREWDEFADRNVFSGSRFTSSLVEPHMLSRVAMVSLPSGTGFFDYATDAADGQGMTRVGATSAGVGTEILLGPESGTATYGRVSFTNTTKVIAACRIKLSVPTVDAGSVAVRGDSRAFAGFWALGLIGSLSTAKFSALIYDDAVTLRSAVSTVSLDNTAWHDLKLYRNGVQTYFQVDGESPILIASGFSSNISNMLEKFYFVRGSAAENQSAGFRSIYTGNAA